MLQHVGQVQLLTVNNAGFSLINLDAVCRPAVHMRTHSVLLIGFCA